MNGRKRKYIAALMALLMLMAQIVPASAMDGHDHTHEEAAPELIRGLFRYAGMYNNVADSQLDYAYSDAYFTGDARVYNPSLSTMSLCLEMSSWSSLNEENWADKTINARNLLTELGFEGFEQNDFWSEAPTVESIGVVGAHKDLGDATVIALAVRGGGYFSEWGSNVRVGGDGEHDGFAQARDNVVAFLNDYVERYGVTGRVKLWVVGFSRGGAVANMTAGYLNLHGLSGAATLAPEDLYCYTFEAPQGTLNELAGTDADFGNIHNVINANDIVPLVAPAAWGFRRYNKGSHLLPTITTTHYAEAFERMQQHYADVLSYVDVLDPAKAEYGITEYARTLEVKVNWLKFLPGGEPFVEILMVDNTHLPQAVMLVESVDALAMAARSRGRFYENVEADISMLLGQLLSAESGASLSDYVQVLGDVFTADDYANTVYVLEPLMQLSLTSFEDRLAQVTERLREVIPQPEGYTDIVGTVGTLADVMGAMITENPRQVLNLVLSLTGSKLIQAHYAEITMAWLRNEDPNFTDVPYAYATPEQARIMRVNCPVDVYVFNSREELVASIVGGEATCFVPGIGCAVNPDGEKVLCLPADESFTVTIMACGDGAVNCSIGEFNIVRGRYTRIVSFPDVDVLNGDVLTALLPALAEEEYQDPAEQGSTAAYSLFFNRNAAVDPAEDLRDDDVAYHRVSVERNNEFGQVLGGGACIHGSFAQVEAYPVSGGAFEGWYIDGVCVSGELVYRFAVKNDVTIVAHFAEAPLGHVTFVPDGNGVIHNVNRTYPAGSYVLLAATPDEGHMLSSWNTTAGEIIRESNGQVYLVVAEGDATVTAAFAEVGVTCPGCRQQLPKGEHHLALCGFFGHYTCQSGFDIRLHLPCRICDDGFICEGGHGDGSGECGVYICAGCGAEILKTESHAAPCGTSGHWTCAADYDAANHTTCEHCSALLCDGNDHGECAICGSGHVCEGGHGTGSGECGVYICEGCGAEILKTESHAAPCGTVGHWTCAADYDAALHTTCEHCSALLCDGNDHGECAICGSGYVCEGGHGTGSGECGVYICAGCGAEILKTESHAAPCGTSGHWTCAADYDAANHTTCEHCSALLCDGNDHGECAICGSGYVCEGGHGTGSGECGVYICAGCSAEILKTESHAAPCGTVGHWTCAADYDAAVHTTCEHCSALLCDGNDHGECAICGSGYVCEGGHGPDDCGVHVCENCGQTIPITTTHASPCGANGHWMCDAEYAADAHDACAHCSRPLCDGRNHGECPLCGNGYVCEGGHGYGEGQCSGPAPSTSWIYCGGCGNWLADGENHKGPCGYHFTCESGYIASEHTAMCELCGEGLCSGEHGTGAGQCSDANEATGVCESCGETLYYDRTHLAGCCEHYTCQSGFEAGEHVWCEVSNDGYICDGYGHGTGEGQCGYVDPADLITCVMCGAIINLNESDPHLGACGKHYTCQTLDFYGDHDVCYGCGDGYVCDGTQHRFCPDCGSLRCSSTTPHSVCAICGGYVCSANSDQHGDGLCGTAVTGNARTMPLWTALPVSGLTLMGATVLRPQRRKKDDE